MSNKKIKIELSAHDALILASFHNEFSQDLEGKPECVTLRMAMNNFFEDMCSKMPDELFEEAKQEIAIDVLLGRAPDNR